MDTQTFGLLELILWWKTEDIWGQILRLSHDTRYYEYGYQCCIWDPGIILSEQSNYPIKIGPGPHLIVSGDQVSPGIGGSQTLYITITNDSGATKSQTVRIPAFKDPPLCLQKWPYFQELDQNHVSLSGRPGQYLRSICNQFGFYQ